MIYHKTATEPSFPRWHTCCSLIVQEPIKMNAQKTIKERITCHSVGLHSGRKVRMTIFPAGTDTGIVFHRRDVPGGSEIRAHLNNVSDTTLATTLGLNGTRISTVEHLLSALYGMGIDNAVVEVDSFEVPIMDGSALPFVHMFKKTGIVDQQAPRKMAVITRPVEVTEGECRAAFTPSDTFEITYVIDFAHPVIGTQSYHMLFSPESYEREICEARTFGFLHQVEFLQARGLALGGSLKNAIVLDEEKVINKEGLRVPDEFVKHKILDAIGDLSLLGMPIVGHFSAYKSGHKLNNLLLRKLEESRDCWKIVEGGRGSSADTVSFPGDGDSRQRISHLS